MDNGHVASSFLVIFMLGHLSLGKMRLGEKSLKKSVKRNSNKGGSPEKKR